MSKEVQHLLFAILTNESYLYFSRNTEKIPLWAIMITIMTIATLSNVQHMVNLKDSIVVSVSAALYIIPAVVIAVVNGALFRQLKRLLNSNQFSSATNEIKKVLFKIQLTNLIAFIFVGSQVAYALYAGLAIVSWFFFVFFLKFTYKLLSFPVLDQ